jgi:hypothetical protein
LVDFRRQAAESAQGRAVPADLNPALRAFRRRPPPEGPQGARPSRSARKSGSDRISGVTLTELSGGSTVRRLFIGCCISFALGVTAIPASAQVPAVPSVPIPDLPPPPAQAKPVVDIVSPAIFQACQGEATAVQVVQIVNALVGLPVPPETVINPVRDLNVACAYFRPTVVPPRCSVDGNIPAAPVNLPRPASIVASEVLAIEKALNGAGAPVGRQLTDPVYGQLGCTGKR